MGKEWRDSIVILIDLIGVKKSSQSGLASHLMLTFHDLIAREVGHLPSINHAYVWNDSVILLGYVDRPNATFQSVMLDADNLKRQIDQITKSYAVAVKGQTFPQHKTKTKNGHGLTVIKASSWAMANCFEIEASLGSTLKKPWYVDGWIKSRIQTSQTFQRERVPLLPSNRPRTVYIFDGYLWDRYP